MIHEKTKKRLLVDMDGIITDLMGKILDRYFDTFGVRIHVSDVTDYHLDKLLPQGDAVHRWLHEPGFYRNLEPIPGSITNLKHLVEMYDITIVTSPGSNLACVQEKSEWLDTHVPFIKSRIYTTDKYLVGGDYFLDDSAWQLSTWKKEQKRLNRSGKILTIEYVYNSEIAKTVDFRGGSYENLKQAWNNIANYLSDEYLYSEGP